VEASTPSVASSILVRVALCATITGCLGEPPLVDFGDSDTDDVADDERELLHNGSFEEWSGAAPAGWGDGDATLEEITDDVVEGDRAVRVVSMTYDSIGQQVTTPIAAGSCLDFEVALRWDSGAADAPVVLLNGIDELGTPHEEFVAVDWSTDGVWRETDAQFATGEAWTSLGLSVNSNSAGAQAFSVDAVSLRLVPCA
jgi:hypothetical protein